ncbi:MAG: hypothetical protein ACR5LG_15095 [Sodalis sp. (in: enterobacteria)]|uniref:hypothetical protein n=1 Tax=Sodalis sp. (in: enterobacteria) TaxID=1898979 RepID=UPI003F3360F7
MDIVILRDTLMQLLPGVPLTLELAISSVALGFFLALLLTLMRLSGVWILDNVARLR